MIKIRDNIIEWNNKQFEFGNKIFEADGDNNRIVVAFQTDENDGLDNVYCFDKNQKSIWRIHPVPEEIGGKMKATYVGVNYSAEGCYVIDFYGRRFAVDKNTGYILSKDIVK